MRTSVRGRPGSLGEAAGKSARAQGPRSPTGTFGEGLPSTSFPFFLSGGDFMFQCITAEKGYDFEQVVSQYMEI